MAEAAIKPDLYLLKRMQPLAHLSPAVLNNLTQKGSIQTIPAGEVIFSAGQHDKRVLFLISGQLEIVTGSNRHVLEHKNPLASQPLSLYSPRPVTAIARERCSLLVFEQADLDEASNNHEPVNGYELEELALEGDHHTFAHLLNTPDLLELPPEDIEVVLSNVERIEIERGQVMIWQGDNDPWYYTILQGQARVTRIPDNMEQEITLAELGPGSRFGEEALITGNARNATVTMLTDATLLRLHGDIFIRHVVKSYVPQLSYASVIEELKRGASFIDVRNEDEYRQNGYGMNIPLQLLRLKLKHFEKGMKYIMACNDGRQSLAAAFLAKRHGVDVCILDGGLDSTQQFAG